MSNPCIKTGAVVYFEECEAYLVGDLYFYGGLYILNSTGCNKWIYEPQRYNLLVDSSYANVGHAVRVMRKEDCYEWSYEGKELE